MVLTDMASENSQLFYFIQSHSSLEYPLPHNTVSLNLAHLMFTVKLHLSTAILLVLLCLYSIKYKLLDKVPNHEIH